MRADEKNGLLRMGANEKPPTENTHSLLFSIEIRAYTNSVLTAANPVNMHGPCRVCVPRRVCRHSRCPASWPRILAPE